MYVCMYRNLQVSSCINNLDAQNPCEPISYDHQSKMGCTRPLPSNVTNIPMFFTPMERDLSFDGNKKIMHFKTVELKGHKSKD